jgi:hypothetical protein
MPPVQAAQGCHSSQRYGYRDRVPEEQPESPRLWWLLVASQTLIATSLFASGTRYDGSSAVACYVAGFLSVCLVAVALARLLLIYRRRR